MPRKRPLKPTAALNSRGKPRQRSRNGIISPKIEQAIDALAQAAVMKQPITLAEAAERVGLRRESLSRALRRGEVAARAQSRVRELIGGQGLILAGARLVELIRSDSDYVSLDAAKHTLAIAGIKPREQGAAAGGGLTIIVAPQYVMRPPAPSGAPPESGTTAPLIEHARRQAVDGER